MPKAFSVLRQCYVYLRKTSDKIEEPDSQRTTKKNHSKNPSIFLGEEQEEEGDVAHHAKCKHKMQCLTKIQNEWN